MNLALAKKLAVVIAFFGLGFLVGMKPSFEMVVTSLFLLMFYIGATITEAQIKIKGSEQEELPGANNLYDEFMPETFAPAHQSATIKQKPGADKEVMIVSYFDEKNFTVKDFIVPKENNLFYQEYKNVLAGSRLPTLKEYKTFLVNNITKYGYEFNPKQNING